MELTRNYLRRFTFIVLVLFITGCAGTGPQTKSKVAAGARITILHVNDTHSNLDAISGSLKFNGVETYLDMSGFGRVATKISKERSADPDALVLHAGDVIQGTFYFNKFQGEPEYAIMNLIKFDAMAIGNHEFDKGPAMLAKYIDDWAKFPIVAANVDTSKDDYLKGKIRPYVIKTIKGEKVGIFGLTVSDRNQFVDLGKVTLDDEKIAAQRTVKELEKQGVNRIIALDHLGYDKDIELAKSVDGIDVVVGGHSHTLLGDRQGVGLKSEGPYPTIVSDPKGNKVCIVQSWEYAKTVGVLEVDFDAGGHITSCGGNAPILVGDTFLQKDSNGKKVEVDSVRKAEILAQIAANPGIEVVKEDPQVISLLAPYKAEITKMEKTVIANVKEDLLHIREPGTHKSGVSLPNGSLIAPIVCEGMLWKAKSAGLNADIAVVAGANVRIDIPAGNLTPANVYALLPFENPLVVMKLTGKEVKAGLESDLRISATFPYVAGIRYTANKTKPEGSRLVSVEIKEKSGKWSALKDDTVYTVIADHVLSSSTGQVHETGLVDTKVFIEYAQHVGTLSRLKDTGITYITKP